MLFSSRQKNSPDTNVTDIDLFSSQLAVVVGGWGGAGKTSIIRRALEEFGDRVGSIGVIINERSQSSVETDLARLPEGFERLGIHGCACCSQLADVLTGVTRFASSGRTLTFIEESPLSVTRDVKNGLASRGLTHLTLFVFNPKQFLSAPAIQTQGIRDADLVLLTHCQGDRRSEESGKKIIAAARGDLTPVPVVVDGAPSDRVPHEVWSACRERLGNPRGSVLSSLSRLFSSGSKLPEGFESERGNLLRQYSEITLHPTISSEKEIAPALEVLRSKGIVLSRVKGVLANGVGVDVVEENGSYRVSTVSTSGMPECLTLRSFTTPLRSHLALLAATLAMPDCSEGLVDSVSRSFPSRGTIKDLAQRGFYSSGGYPLGFEGDRLLSDLRLILPAAKEIQNPEKRKSLGNALVRLLSASADARLGILDHVAAKTPSDGVAALNAAMVVAEYLVDPALSGLLSHPDLVKTLAGVKGEAVFDRLAIELSSGRPVRFEGRADLSRNDVARISTVLRLGEGRGFLAESAKTRVLESLRAAKDPDMQAHSSAIGV
jgi:hypothetical protein